MQLNRILQWCFTGRGKGEKRDRRDKEDNILNKENKCLTHSGKVKNQEKAKYVNQNTNQYC